MLGPVHALLIGCATLHVRLSLYYLELHVLDEFHNLITMLLQFALHIMIHYYLCLHVRGSLDPWSDAGSNYEHMLVPDPTYTFTLLTLFGLVLVGNTLKCGSQFVCQRFQRFEACFPHGAFGNFEYFIRLVVYNLLYDA